MRIDNARIAAIGLTVVVALLVINPGASALDLHRNNRSDHPPPAVATTLATPVSEGTTEPPPASIRSSWSPPGPPRLQGTLVAFNGSFVPGEFEPVQSSNPSALAYDNRTHQLFLSIDDVSNNQYAPELDVLSIAQNRLVGTLPLPVGTSLLCYGGEDGRVFVAGYGSTGELVAISDTTYRSVQNITLSGYPTAIACDPTSGLVFVAMSTGGPVSVFFGNNGSLARSVLAGDEIDSLTYDAATGQVLATGWSTDAIEVLSGSNGSVEKAVRLSFLPSLVLPDSTSGQVLVPNPVSGKVAVLSASTDQWLTNLTLPQIVDDGGFDPALGAWFVGSGYGGNLTEISDPADAVIGNLTLSSYPTAFAYAVSNGELYASSEWNDTVTAIANLTAPDSTILLSAAPSLAIYDPAIAGMVLAEQAPGDAGGGATAGFLLGYGPGATAPLVAATPEAPGALAYDAATSDLYGVGEFAGSPIEVYSGSTLVPLGTIPTCAGASLIAFDPINSSLIVGCPHDVLWVESASNGSTVTTIGLASAPVAFTTSGEGSELVVAEAGGFVQVISMANFDRLKEIDLGFTPGGLAADDATGQILVSNPSREAVEVVALANGTVVANVSDPLDPRGVAFDPTSREAFVTDAELNVLTVIAGWSDAVLSTLSVGSPGSVTPTLDPVSGAVWVPNTESGTVSLVAQPPAAEYRANFAESGLDNGTPWSLRVNNTTLRSAGAISLELANGTYEYQLPPVGGYSAHRVRGLITVHGAPVSTEVEFVAPTYPVTLTETGIPTGASWWSINLTAANSTGAFQAVSEWTVHASVDLSLHNGSYVARFDSGSPEWVPTVTSVAFSIVGEGRVVDAPFEGNASDDSSPDVYVSELGLPSTTTWMVQMNGSGHFWIASGITTTIGLSLPPGAYSYWISTPTGTWAAAPAHGTIAVAGTPVNVATRFSPAIVEVSVLAEGLPAGVRWALSLADGISASIAAGSGTVLVPTGEYAFRVSSGNPVWTPEQPTGNLSIVPGSVFTFEFSEVVYAVDFVETGLPPGDGWAVTLGNQTGTAVGTELQFSAEPNGSYPYTIPSASGYSPAGSRGTVEVHGSVSVIAVFFAWGAPPATGRLSEEVVGSSTLTSAIALGLIVVAALLFVRRPRSPFRWNIRDTASAPRFGILAGTPL
jgi:hypothetical protein